MSATLIRDTSLQAYDGIKASGQCGAQARAILEWVRCDDRRWPNPEGWTLQEISYRTGISINATAGRVNDLKKSGLLFECQKRRCTVTGRTVTPVTARKPEPEQLALM